MGDYCYLCENNAATDKGVIFYRYYDQYDKRWVNEPMCMECWVKLKGPVRAKEKI